MIRANLDAASRRLADAIEQAARCAGNRCCHSHTLDITLARAERDAAARLWRESLGAA
jgi:hypothetical protein